MKRVFYAIILSLVAVGCTKKLSYKEKSKDQVQDKAAVIDEQSVYLYAPSSGSTSRTSGDARPFFMGETKKVKMRLTEKTLQIYEVESDTRFQGNEANKKVVMEIPVSHVDFRCTKDRYGECTGSEEEDGDLRWDLKRKFKPDFSSVKVMEASVLPIEIEKLFGSGCYSELGSRLLDYEMTAEAINFRVEKTFNANLNCLMDLDSLSDITTTAVYHYSMVKLSSMATPDYKEFLYPKPDQNIFGFFTTEIKKVDVDNRMTTNSEVSYLNRWNPNRKEIVYYLSDEFNKPENASIKRATYKAFEKMNKGLESAGVKFRMILKDPAGKQPGDIRNSMIILVEDPSQAGLLGYGPSIANPDTGEILSAKTVMYSGILKTSVRAVYEEIRRKSLQKKAAQSPSQENSKLTKVKQAGDNKKGHGTLDMSLNFNNPSMAALIEDFTKNQGVKSSTPSGKNSVNSNFTQARVQSLVKEIKNYTSRTDFNSNPIDMLMAKRGSCLFTVDQMDFSKLIAQLLNVMAGQELKKWQDLSATEKQKIIDVILPETWTTTLVHELGHNLGLRHNFAGSEDKENYYTEKELKDQGIAHPITSSTVMEYSGSEFNALPTLGKYDIAALRFGYQGVIETSNNQKVTIPDGQSVSKIPTTEDETVGNIIRKSYKFCTDEHAGINAGCKQFDQGSSYEEIARYLVEQYEEYSKLRNYRNDDYNFSLLHDARYASRIERTFNHMRLFLDVVERVSNSGLSPADPLWNSIPFLADLRKAAVISGQFFFNILATPNLHCLIAPKADPNQIEILPAEDLKGLGAFITCEQLGKNPRLNELGFQVLGELGRNYTSKKSPDNENPYVDQVDVRGIWIDKVMASKYLLSRHPRTTIRSSMETSFNYLDLPEFQKPLLQNLMMILTNSVQASNIPATLLNGEVVKVPVPLRYDVFNSHLIPKPLTKTISNLLGLPYRDVYLQESILSQIVTEASEEARKDVAAKDRLEYFSVHKTKAIFGNAQAQYPKEVVVLNAQEYVLAATPKNILARALMQFFDVSTKLSAIKGSDEEKAKAIRSIIEAREKNQTMPENADEATKNAWQMDLALLKQYDMGLIDSDPQFYVQMLFMLPAAN